MAKNITLSIPDDLATEMETLTEINWSAVAKKAIQTYIEIRKNPDIEPLLKKLRQEQNEEYIQGRQRADKLVALYGYKWLDLLLQPYFQAVQDVEYLEDVDCSPETPDPIEEFKHSYYENKTISSKTKTDDEYAGAQLSNEHLKGLRERLVEIYETLMKLQQ